MNKETINLPKLISEVANGASVDPATSRRFLHELFSMVENSLRNGENITIKGIGTFSRSDDSEKSVIFQPDQALSEAANEPFAAFSAVELNDGAAEEIMAVGTTRTEAVEESPRDEHEPGESEAAEAPKAEPDEITPEESGTEAMPDTEAESAPSAHAVEPAEKSTKNEPEPPAPEPAEKPAEPIKPIEATEPTETSEPVETAEPAPQPAPARKDKSDSAIWMVLGVLIGLILGLVGGYFAGKTMAAYELPAEDETDTEEIELYEPEKNVLETPAAPEVKAATVPVEQQTKIEASTAPAAVQQPVQPASKPAPKPVYDTITKTRYLSILAREHYGAKKYWVFIYQANPQLGDPNKVSPGTRVLIPAKESFMEATPEATDAKAQRLLNQLAKKYKL